MVLASVLLFAPGTFILLAWILLLRSGRRGSKVERAALGTATLLSAFAISLYVRTLVHPEYARLPPWQDPVNLEAVLMMFFAPVPAVLGLVAAAKKAPWWLVALVELVSLPLMLVGCGAAVSV